MGGKLQKLTRAQIDEIVRLREEKRKSPKLIAQRFGISASAVIYHLLRNGVDPWDGERAHTYKKVKQRSYTPEEDARMIELGRQGFGPHRIAMMMGRPKTSLLIRLLTLEVRAEKAVA